MNHENWLNIIHTGVRKMHVINVRPCMGGPKKRIFNSIFCWWAGLWIKDLLSMAPPIRTRPRFLLSQSLPSGSFHKPLILLHQRADRLKTTVTGNWPIWSHAPQPYLIQWNYEPCRVGPPKTDWSWWEFWQNTVHWRREWQTTSAFLPWEPHEQYEKAER